MKVDGWVDEDEDLDDLFGPVVLWPKVTEGLDPVGRLRAAELYFALAEAQVALDIWAEVVRATRPSEVFDRVYFAYRRVLTPFELWLAGTAARASYDEETVAVAVARLPRRLHDAAHKRLEFCDDERVRLAALHEQHLVATLKPRRASSSAAPGVDDEVLQRLVARLKIARAQRLT